MYRIVEIALADMKRLFRYKLDGVYHTNFSIKGFDYPWILTSHDWQKGERLLDVGAAYSPLPAYLHDNFGCEAWAVDDFGMGSGEDYWLRNNSPQEFVAGHPQVHYVLERLGDPSQSSLPAGYFDVIYSISALEHIPGGVQADVWRQMDSLLRPGGELIHAVDVDFPSNFGLPGMIKAAALNLLYPFIPRAYRQKYCLVTPRAYLRLISPGLGIPLRETGDLSILNMALNPDVLADSYDFGFNRIQKGDDPNYRFQRVGSLLIHLKKLE
jgi:SAM-dependent methyltransferase